MPRKSNYEKYVRNATAEEIEKATEEEANLMYRAVARELKKRAAGFRSGDRYDKFQKVYKRIKSPERLTDAEKKEWIVTAREYLMGRESTYEGWTQAHNERREMLQERFGLEKLTDSQMERYGAFMGDMQSKYGQDWGMYSAEAQKIAVDAVQTREGDLEQFKSNFEFWLQDTENKMAEYKTLYTIAHNLGLDPIEVTDNAREWIEHPEKLDKIREERISRGKRKSSKDASRSLKLPRIRRR